MLVPPSRLAEDYLVAESGAYHSRSVVGSSLSVTRGTALGGSEAQLFPLQEGNMIVLYRARAFPPHGATDLCPFLPYTISNVDDDEV